MRVLLAILTLGWGLSSMAQQPHAKVQLRLNHGFLDLPETFQCLHGHQAGEKTWELILDSLELVQLEASGLPYRIIEPDMESWYARHLSADLRTHTRTSCGLTHYLPGSGAMGGYHTYQEVGVMLDSMRLLYPRLISPKRSVGKTAEGRDIWVVKMSDQPQVDESATEPAVYIDALTHAREPMSLEATLYFMWWALENHGKDPEATYLLNEREWFIIPVVNPDGYVYNQTIQPNGGGLWRKNRATQVNGCVGVDLNRNFSFGWGLGVGSTSDPCSNIFRGTSAFSEPETKAVKTVLDSVKPVIAFTHHSYGQKFLNPIGYIDSVVNYEIYADLASKFIPASYAGYGTVKQMLNYTSAGTTRDYFHNEQIIGWTTEIGTTFWEPPSRICELAQEMAGAMRYIGWAAGARAQILQPLWDEVLPGDTARISLSIKNRGLSQASGSLGAKITSLAPELVVLKDSLTLGSVPARQRQSFPGLQFPLLLSPQAQAGQALAFRLELYQSGVLVDEKIAYLYPGAQDTLFADDFEQNLNQWLYPLDAIRWDQSVIDPVQGSFCLADSKYGNYGSQKSLFLFLAQGLDLSQTFAPYLSFQAQWSLEPGQDSVRLEGLDATGHWIPLQSFTGHQAWKEIRIDLDAFRHPNFRIRFHLRSNPLVQGDGIYLDQFRIIDFLPTAISNLEEMEDWQVVLGPNPVEDALHLKIGTRRNGPLEIRLWDMKGSAILRSQIEKSPSGFYEARFSVQHLAAGIYSLELKTEQGRRMYKIWKK